MAKTAGDDGVREVLGVASHGGDRLISVHENGVHIEINMYGFQTRTISIAKARHLAACIIALADRIEKREPNA